MMWHEAALLLAQTASDSPNFTTLALQYGGASLIAVVAWITQQKRIADRDKAADLLATKTAETLAGRDRAAGEALAAKDKDLAVWQARVTALEAQLARCQDERVRAADDWAQQNKELALRMVPTLEKASQTMVAVTNEHRAP